MGRVGSQPTHFLTALTAPAFSIFPTTPACFLSDRASSGSLHSAEW